MPGNVDERVVEMRIDNKQFESGAKTTISTLEKLERALHLKGDSKALDDMARSVSNFDASPMASSIDKVGEHFNALEIAGRRVIENLTDSVYGFATKTVKDLTIGQVEAGWDKYADKTEAVQSIMAATRDQFDSEAEQMKVINELLDKMMWYTDETSYNFVDMAQNVGKFLAAGVGLGEGESIADPFNAMMGIASWGASAGAKPQEVSRAMYNISQALSTGKMAQIDWKSIENAGMATLEFKQNVIDTAVELGKLRVWEGVGETNQGIRKFYDAAEDMSNAAEDTEKLFDAKSFREQLKSGWFDTDVMSTVFQRYAEFTDALYEGYQTTGMEATDLLKVLDRYRTAAEKGIDFNWGEQAEYFQTDVEDLQKAIQALIDTQWEYSEQGFRMGQEAKTWEDTIEATKDAVSSKWMRTFQWVIGDYIEAKEFWTEVTGRLYDIFAAGGDVRNAILEAWYDKGGRDAWFALADPDDENSPVGAFWSILDSLSTITEPIHAAFDEIFGLADTEGIGERLAEISKRIQEISANMGLSEEAQKGLKNIFSAIFSGSKTAIKAFGGVLGVLGKFAWFIGEVLDAVLSLASGEVSLEEVQKRITDAFWNFIEPFSIIIDKVKNFDISSLPVSLSKVIDYLQMFKNDAISASMTKLYNSMSGFEKMLADAGKKFPFLIDVFSTFGSILEKVTGDLPSFDNMLGSVINWIKQLKNAFNGTKIDLTGIKGIFGRAGDIADVLISALFGDIDTFREKVKTLVTTALNGILDAISEIKISDVLKAIRIGITAGFLGGFLDIVRSFHMVANEVKSIPEAISDTLGSLQKSFEATSYIKIAVAIGILAASIYALSKVPADDFMRIVLGLGLLALVLQKVSKGINIFSGSNNTGDTITKGLKANIKLIPDLAATILALSVAMGVMAAAVVSFKKNGIGTGKNGWADLLMPIGTMLITLASILGFLYLLKKYNLKDVGKSFGLFITLFAVIGRVTSLVKATKNVPWQNILAAMVGMGAVIAAMALTLRFASGFKKFKGNSILHMAAVFVAFGFAIQQISMAMIPLAVMSWDKMAQALLGAGAMMLMLGGMIAWMSRLKGANTEGLIKTAGAMAIMAVSIKLLMGPLLAMAVLPFGAMLKGIAVIGMLLLMLGGLTAWMSRLNGSKAGGLIKIVGAVALLSIALTALLPSIMAFTGFMVTLAAVLKGKMIAKLLVLSAVMVVLGAGLLVAGAGIALFGVGMLGVATSALMFSLALLAIASGLNKISTAFPQFIQGLIDAGKLMTKENALNIGKGALAFLALAAAVFLLAKAFGALFGNGDILAKLGGFGGRLVTGIGSIFRNIGATVASHVPELLKVLGAVAVAVGLYLTGAIPKFVSWAVQSIATLLESIHQSVRANKGALEHSVFGTVEVLLEVLFDAGTWLISLVRGLIDTGVSWLLNQIAEKVASIPLVGDDLANSIRGIVNELPTVDEIMSQWNAQKATNEQWLQQFVPPAQELRDASENVTESIGQGVLDGQSSVTDAFGTVKTTIDEAMSGIGENAQLEGGNVISMFSGGIGENMGVLDDAFGGVSEHALGAFDGLSDDMKVTGSNVMAGLNDGIVSFWNSGRIQGNLDTITNSINKRTRLGLGEHSPSKIAAEAGAFYIIGLANGIADNAKIPLDAIDDTTDPMVEALKRAMTQVATMTDDDFGFSPVITPVVDMSNVNSAAGSMNGLFGGINRVAAVQAERYSSYAPASTRDNSVVNELQSLSSRMDALGETITNMQIVLDTGVLVGATSAKMDRQLGVMAGRKARGN